MKLWQALLAIVLLGDIFALMIVKAQPQPPGQPLICGGGVTILLEGMPLASGCVLNIKAGPGILATPQANPAIGGTDLSFGYNTALIPTHDQAHANENFCESTNGTSLYTCKLPNKALLAYQRGQTFLLVVDAPCIAGCSVNIDKVGPKALKQDDGLTDPGNTLLTGRARWIFYDGTIFRLL